MAQEQEYLAKKKYVDENYQPKLVPGTGISINPVTNEITSSGGGSLVTYAGNPNLSQGDSLGVLTINGVPNVIMSPGLIPGTNVTITTDIATGAKTIATTGGTTVTPNPQGTPSGVLTSIGIGNAIYSLQGGAYYGTTDPDSSLGIDGDIYIKYTSGTPDTINAMFVKINDEWVEDVISGGSLEAEEMTTAEYNALPTEDKQDAGVIHFLNDTVGGESETDVIMTAFYNRNEGAMSISVVDDELVYHWNGGSAIGASSYYPTVIPATVSKIKYKITTGGSYSTTTQRFKIAIGVKATYNTSAWASAEDTDWLAVDIQNTQNTEYEGEVDLSEISTDSYLMIGAHGWTVTFNEIKLVEEIEPTGTTKIMYKDVAYGVGSGGGSGGGAFEKTNLYTNSGTGFENTITLSDDFDNYDYLEFVTYKSDDGTYDDALNEKFISKEILLELLDNSMTSKSDTFMLIGDPHNGAQYARYSVASKTSFSKVWTNGAWTLKEINGIKLESGGGGGSVGGYVEKYTVSAGNYRGYNLILTHEDNSTVLTQEVPSSGDSNVVFEIPKAGEWVLSNNKDNRTLVHRVNIVTETFGGINQPFTLDAVKIKTTASESLDLSVQCSVGYYVVLIGTTGRGTESGYSPVGVSVTSGNIIGQQKVFDSANPLADNWCSDMRVLIIEATDSTTISITNGTCDRGRAMILHTSDALSENSIKLVGTRKDSTYTGTCNIDEGNACLFFLGTDGYSKTVTGNGYTAVSQYESNNMGYDYGTATANTSLSISFFGGSSYGSAGVAVIA